MQFMCMYSGMLQCCLVVTLFLYVCCFAQKQNRQMFFFVDGICCRFAIIKVVYVSVHQGEDCELIAKAFYRFDKEILETVRNGKCLIRIQMPPGCRHFKC